MDHIQETDSPAKVTFYYVGEKHGNVHHAWISAFFEAAEDARTALEALRPEHPTARVIQSTVFLSREDDEEREKLLANILPAGSIAVQPTL